MDSGGYRRIQEERLEQIYSLLRETLTPLGEQEADPGWYAPPMPPIHPGSKLSATDLLSWWFRPPTASRSAWDAYFGESPPVQKSAAAAPQPAATASATDPISRAAIRALLPVEENELASEEADRATEVFYEFLHAFGRRDIDAAMQYIADDYHTFEDDREVDRGDLRSRLEALLDGLHGYDFAVSLATVPEPLLHPYGVVMSVEIQIDGVHPRTSAKRNLLDKRLVLLQCHSQDQWKIASMGKVRG
jgi:hypothetical protein